MSPSCLTATGLAGQSHALKVTGYGLGSTHLLAAQLLNGFSPSWHASWANTLTMLVLDVAISWPPSFPAVINQHTCMPPNWSTVSCPPLAREPGFHISHVDNDV